MLSPGDDNEGCFVVRKDRGAEGRIAWAAKDKVIEMLSEGAPLIKRAPRYPTWILVKIERLVLGGDSGPPDMGMDQGEVMGLLEVVRYPGDKAGGKRGVWLLSSKNKDVGT